MAGNVFKTMIGYVRFVFIFVHISRKLSIVAT